MAPVDPPPAGWYPDPERAGWLRWWDGRGWSHAWIEADVRATDAPPASGPVGTPTGAPSPAPGVASSAPRSRRVVPVALAAVGAVSLVVAAVVLITQLTGRPDESAGRGSTRGDAAAAAEVADDRLVDTCGASTLLSIPGTEVEIEPLSLDQEIELGADTRDEVLDAYERSSDDATLDRLEGMLDELRPARTEVPFSVTLLDDDEVNAFVIPGGDIFVTTGIAELMDDDELAFVMAHEMAHALCRHLAQSIERDALAAAGLSALLGDDIDPEDLYANAASATLADLASRSFSRDDESEADLAALDLLDAAGRPLDAAPAALRTLRDLEGEVEPSAIEVFLSTHPPTAARIETVEDAIDDR